MDGAGEGGEEVGGEGEECGGEEGEGLLEGGVVDAWGWGGGGGWRVVRELSFRNGLIVMMFCEAGCYRRIDLDTVM